MPVKNHWRGRGESAPPSGLTNADRAILLWLHSLGGKSVLAKDISNHLADRAFGETGRDAIDRLSQLGFLERHGRNRYRLVAMRLATGRFSRADKGFGFVAIAGRDKDAFIPARKTADALHGDTVLIGIDRRGEGEIIGRPAGQTTILAGICKLAKGRALFLPEDGHFPESLPLLAEDSARGGIGPEVDGQMALAHLIRPTHAPIHAVLQEILGDPDSALTQSRLVIAAHELPTVFSEAALAEAEAGRAPNSCPANRSDLRHIFHLTIDGEDAKDFDDAIAVEKRGETFRLYVSIADVSHYVRKNSILDEEARKRGTSIYFPGLVIPMLPERLSNGLCSLRPGEPRFCLTAILDFSPDGKLTKKNFCRSLIESKKRCTYAEAAAILDAREATPEQSVELWRQTIRLAAELTTLLRRNREEHGAINLNIAEPYFTLDASGHVEAIKSRQAGSAHHLIEECMLAANMAVAEELRRRERAFLYRVHEVPDEEKIDNFYQLARSLGLNPAQPENNPAWFRHILRQVADTEKEYVIGNLLLRTLKQARYAPENIGHFALAAADYCHFTSPIRRYPDLLVHRALGRLFDGEAEPTPTPERLAKWREEGDWLSSRERLAITASREINDRLRVIFMERHVGETFTAVISGVSQTMIFIELIQPPATGAIALETLPEHYFYDREQGRLTGELSHKILAVGDALTVRLTSADRRRQRLNFAIISERKKSRAAAPIRHSR
ncbi:MAG: VacB/RNase II family 3'-5' exoribonuclease [Desulfobulbaceae bacterium]|jgi:ribonuclease R|nr:VacB/RNase II family 3'-5' exoribonuclease [Desulfobulbaceae bacterium]